MAHNYTKDDNKEKERVQHCTEIEEINVKFVYPQRGSNTINNHGTHFISNSKIPGMLSHWMYLNALSVWEGEVKCLMVKSLKSRG